MWQLSGRGTLLILVTRRKKKRSAQNFSDAGAIKRRSLLRIAIIWPSSCSSLASRFDSLTYRFRPAGGGRSPRRGGGRSRRRRPLPSLSPLQSQRVRRSFRGVFILKWWKKPSFFSVSGPLSPGVEVDGNLVSRPDENVYVRNAGKKFFALATWSAADQVRKSKAPARKVRIEYIYLYVYTLAVHVARSLSFSSLALFPLPACCISSLHQQGVERRGEGGGGRAKRNLKKKRNDGDGTTAAAANKSHSQPATFKLFPPPYLHRLKIIRFSKERGVGERENFLASAANTSHNRRILPSK